MKTNGAMILLRQQLYFRRVSPEFDMNKPIVTQLCILWQLLKERECLYLSIHEMIDSRYYQYWKRKPQALADCFDKLVKKGYMVRSRRDSRRTKGATVMIWGLTGKGKAFIRTYYEYLDGRRDDELFATGHPVAETA